MRYFIQATILFSAIGRASGSTLPPTPPRHMQMVTMRGPGSCTASRSYFFKYKPRERRPLGQSLFNSQDDFVIPGAVSTTERVKDQNSSSPRRDPNLAEATECVTIDEYGRMQWQKSAGQVVRLYGKQTRRAIASAYASQSGEEARGQRSAQIREEMQAEDDYREELRLYEKTRKNQETELRKQLARGNSTRARQQMLAAYAVR